MSNAANAVAEASTRHVTKYYYFGGQRVAMRQPEGVYYLHADHLDSTSLTTNGSGGVVARQLYHPFGTVRWASESPLPTDFGYTGQRLDATGLMFYHARYYAPQIGRFVQADTIIPNPAAPQDFNRYSYVGNNPLGFTDPSGHGPAPAVILGGGGASPEVLAQYQAYRAMLEAAQQACGHFGLGAGCYLYEGAIWHNYFTGSSLGATQYIDATGTAAGDEGAYRAAVARQWASYAYGQGLIAGEQNLNWWPNARGATPEQRGMVMLSFAGPGAADATLFLRDHFATPSFSAAGLEMDVYPVPDAAGIGGGAGPWHEAGSLPYGTARQIQSAVDEVGAPVNVVGGYARGDPHPRKDIDYYMEVQYRAQWTIEARELLPGPRCFQANNTEFLWEMGWGRTPPGLHPPYIQFTPGKPPVWVR